MIGEIADGILLFVVGCRDTVPRIASRQAVVFTELGQRNAVHKAALQRIVVLSCEEK